MDRSEIDFGRVGLLLHVIESAAKHGNNAFSALIAEAGFELGEISKIAQASVDERAKVKVEADAEAKAKEAARIAAEQKDEADARSSVPPDGPVAIPATTFAGPSDVQIERRP